MSDQYTPTTEQVREAWVEFARFRLNPKRRFVLGWAGLTRDVIDAAFGRWLASVKADVWDEGSLARADLGHGLKDNPYREGTEI